MSLKHLNGYVDDYDDEREGESKAEGKAHDQINAFTYYPTCRFCGSPTLPDAAYESQEQADEAATIRCNCFEAKQYQEQLERERQRQNNIIKLRQRLDEFSEYCASRGVDLAGDLHTTIFNAGIAVLDGVVLQVSFKFARMKVSISTNSKNTLVIAFTYSDGAKVEV